MTHTQIKSLYRFFRGRETNQIDGHTGKRPFQTKWYYEPRDYTGDTLWSRSYLTRQHAVMAAHDENRHHLVG